MVKEEIQPQSENTVRKYQTQHLYTDTGIEIKIPMNQYKNPKSVEFITNPDGTVSVLIKNIEHLEAKL
jgi:ribosomal protein L32E